MPRSRKNSIAVGAEGAAVAVAASLLVAPSIASAQEMAAPHPMSPGENPADFEGANAFYMPPEQIPAAPGSVIRREPMDLYVTLPNVDGPWPG